MANRDDLEKAPREWTDFAQNNPEVLRKMVEASVSAGEKIINGAQKKASDQEIEATYLARLDAADNQLQATIKSINAIMPLTFQQITFLIGSIQSFETYCRGYEPMAQYLKQAGLPRLFERIEGLVAELRGAEKKYKDMLQSTLNEQTKRGRIWQGVSDQWLTTMRGGLERQNDAFEAQQKRWNADHNRTCINCDASLGDLYYTLTICPSCRLFLH